MNPDQPSIVFAGTPEFAVPALERLVQSGHRPTAVYTQPDRPAGRGRQPRPGAVKTAALRHGLMVHQPESFKSEESRARLAALKPDLMIVIAYGLILPQTVLDIPRFGCWNIHASLLPRWRGAAPIQRAIEAGDSHTGVCIMQMEAGLDTGPVLHSLETEIDPADTGGSLHDRLAELGADALLQVLEQATRGAMPEARSQDDSKALYADKLSKDEARLDWSLPAIDLERQIRAFNPWPVSWTILSGKRLRVWAGEVASATSHQAPGTIISADRSGIAVSTGAQTLLITQVQAEGGRRMSSAEFLNAAAISAGQKLEAK